MVFDWFSYVGVPFLIFFARVFDVSMGTIRVIMTARGHKNVSTVIGFFEVLIWLVAIQQILVNLSNIFCYIAYAGGFATGTYVGMIIEERLSIGKIIVRVITHSNATELLKALREFKHAVTAVDAQGRDGKVHIIFTVVERAELAEIIDIVKQYNPHAFYTIEDVRSSGDINRFRPYKYRKLVPFLFWRKGK